MTYKRTQTGWLTLSVCGALLVLLVVVSAHVPEPRARLIPLYVGVPIMLIVIVLFGSLTVTVNDNAITVQFGPGIIRKNQPCRRDLVRASAESMVVGLGHPADSRRLALQCVRVGCGRIEDEERPDFLDWHG